MLHSAQDIDAAARTVWGEARNQPWMGMLAVAYVILNRAAHRATTLDTEAKRHLQFSCWNENDPNRAKLLAVDFHDSAFRESLAAVAWAISPESVDPTYGSQHYHTEGVAPAWSRGLAPIAIIGDHLFFNDVA